MKLWWLPIVAGSILGGFFVGRSSAPSAAPPSQLSTAPSNSNAMGLREAAPTQKGAVPQTESASPKLQSKTKSALPTKPKSPAEKFVEQFHSFIKGEKLYELLWMEALTNQELQKAVFDILMSTDDVQMLRACQDFPIGPKNPALMSQVISAFKVEQDPERKLVLGRVLANNWMNEKVCPEVLRSLEGSDPALQERMLGRISLQQWPVTIPDEQFDGMRADLRLLAKAGTTDSVRAFAVAAMAGAEKLEDIQSLTESLVRDVSSDVQLKALSSLSNGRLPLSFIDDRSKVMYSIAIDESRTPQVRRKAAGFILDHGVRAGGGAMFGPQELAVMKEVTLLKD